MTIGHAAALALVAWYLMVPPWGIDAVDGDAPIGQWERYQEYQARAASTIGESRN